MRKQFYNNRGVARGGGGLGGSVPPEPAPDFDRSVNPIQTRGVDYAPHTTVSPPPWIQKAIYTSEQLHNSFYLVKKFPPWKISILADIRLMGYKLSCSGSLSSR